VRFRTWTKSIIILISAALISADFKSSTFGSDFSRHALGNGKESFRGEILLGSKDNDEDLDNKIEKKSDVVSYIL